MARRGHQAACQLRPNWPSHRYLQFSDDLEGRASFVSQLINLLYKKIGVPQALMWRVVDEYGLTAQLGTFLTWVLRDDEGLDLFTYDWWSRVFRIREVIFKELCWEFFYTI